MSNRIHRSHALVFLFACLMAPLTVDAGKPAKDPPPPPAPMQGTLFFEYGGGFAQTDIDIWQVDGSGAPSLAIPEQCWRTDELGNSVAYHVPIPSNFRYDGDYLWLNTELVPDGILNHGELFVSTLLRDNAGQVIGRHRTKLVDVIRDPETGEITEEIDLLSVGIRISYNAGPHWQHCCWVDNDRFVSFAAAAVDETGALIGFAIYKVPLYWDAIDLTWRIDLTDIREFPVPGGVLFAWSPDGSTLAFCVSYDDSWGTSLYTQRDGDPLPVHVYGNADQRVDSSAWSPDTDPVQDGYQGRIAISVSSRNNSTVALTTINPDGTDSRVVTTMTLDIVVQPLWQPFTGGELATRVPRYNRKTQSYYEDIFRLAPDGTTIANLTSSLDPAARKRTIAWRHGEMP
ncbi:MAG: TolB-like translocation protein [Pirellulaceae bacterium]